MSLSPSLEAAFNSQIHIEFDSVYAYLQLSADFKERNLDGFSTWMHLQSQEEWEHAMKFTDFVLSRGGSVRLQAIEAPKSGFAAPIEAFERALAHEQRVTKSIHDLYARAMAESDFASLPLLQWFVNEQVEEEATVAGIVERLRMVGAEPTGLLFMDRELAARAAGGRGGS